VFTRLVSLAEDCDKEGTDILTTPVNCYATLEGNARDLEGLAISPDGKILASGGWDKAVRLGNLPDGELLKTLKGSKEWITCLVISPDNQILASSGLRLVRQGGAPTEVIQLWNLRDGTKLHTLTGTHCYQPPTNPPVTMVASWQEER
jgi:WD40 repeat protein